jgi:alkanesulfonate monooxygenase SsuD/methylene tetrahydromethanopterin reductase-like flavin-dependent oxidoreductase (luciferase family)
MFLQPNHPPERTTYDAIQQDLQEIDWLDELGYSEVFVGEHLTAPWEPLPACDLVIAQALARTANIRVCSGGYIPAFFHPAALAMRIAQLDHMAQGRYICGIAAGSVPGDFRMLNIDPAAGEHRDRTYEAVNIIKKIWTSHFDGEWTYEGKYWTVNNPAWIGPDSYPHIRPYQDPHPPIAIAGMSPSSSSLKYAGENGFIPMSVFFNAGVLKSHWDVYSEAAAAAGHAVSRGDWRVNRSIFVAETDEEAREYVRNSYEFTVWRQNYLPAFTPLGWLKHLKHDDSVPDEDVDVEYLLNHLFIVGSPDTVTAKLTALNEEVGEFGVVLGTHFDWGTVEDAYAHSEAYRRHLELFAKEVIPRVDTIGAS